MQLNKVEKAAIKIAAYLWALVATVALSLLTSQSIALQTKVVQLEEELALQDTLIAALVTVGRRGGL
ncbi:MAG: hypothetical protein V3T22_05340 [Planctomycetota bacterium]